VHIFADDRFLFGLDDDVLSGGGANTGQKKQARGCGCEVHFHDLLLGMDRLPLTLRLRSHSR
jgi:hypothetical protein